MICIFWLFVCWSLEENEDLVLPSELKCEVFPLVLVQIPSVPGTWSRDIQCRMLLRWKMWEIKWSSCSLLENNCIFVARFSFLTCGREQNILSQGFRKWASRRNWAYLDSGSISKAGKYFSLWHSQWDKWPFISLFGIFCVFFYFQKVTLPSDMFSSNDQRSRRTQINLYATPVTPRQVLGRAAVANTALEVGEECPEHSATSAGT